MIRTKILGLGSYVPERVVDNHELAFLDDRHVRQPTRQTETSDEWIQQRTGVRERRYVPNDGSVWTSDLALHAARRALADAGVDAAELDCIIFGTLSPDFHFPGTGVILQTKLGIAERTSCACFDIRQQCSAFIYGLQMADAFIRTGTYRRILLVGAELHSHALDFTTRGRDVTVLFGDGAGALVLGPVETDDPRAGVVYTSAHADGTGASDLCLKIFEIARLPYLDYDARDRDHNALMYPRMEGKRVFLHAVRGMVMSTQAALARTGMTWDDIQWFVPHQANLRINEKVAEVAGIPRDKVLNTIELYGNTTAASVPLTIDHWRQHGRVKRGDRILSSVFGSGFTWGAAIFTL
ncbi:MAG: beta-ketoacyl-ACP synthase III [Deltaproteobacteria bacterium]|nr:MAG: beta-ketoacyl-ACP synthase III [Deltaproteobacteria bacterium]TMQ15748.1 MAG: beta-ketoacyl-ACP synthase III [Deltaproteobacteria bacterium]